MIYFSLLIIIILSLRYHLSLFPIGIKRDKIENKYCIFIWFLIIIMAGFRDEMVGTDTISYITDYYDLNFMSINQIKERHENYIGFFIFSKLLSLLNMPVWFWFASIQAIYAFSISKLINRYSKDKLFSILLFVTIGLFTFSMAGLKQVMAMSFILLAFIYFEKSKFILSIILIFTAFTFHPSSLIFVPTFFLYYLRDKKYFVYLFVIALVIISLFGSDILPQFVAIGEIEHFEMYLKYDNSYTSTSLIFYSVIITIALIGYKSYLHTNKQEAKFLLGFSLLVIGLETLSSISPSMFRLAYYYAPFMLVFIPNSLSHRSDLTLRLRILEICCIIFYFLYVNRNFNYTLISK